MVRPKQSPICKWLLVQLINWFITLRLAITKKASWWTHVMADAFGMCYYKLLKILLVAVLSFFKEWTPWFLLRVSTKCPTNWATLMYVEKNSTKYHGQCHKNYLLNCLSFSSNMRYVRRSITVVMLWPLPKMLFSNFFPGVTKHMSGNIWKYMYTVQASS